MRKYFHTAMFIACMSAFASFAIQPQTEWRDVRPDARLIDVMDFCAKTGSVVSVIMTNGSPVRIEAGVARIELGHGAAEVTGQVERIIYKYDETNITPRISLKANVSDVSEIRGELVRMIEDARLESERLYQPKGDYLTHESDPLFASSISI